MGYIYIFSYCIFSAFSFVFIKEISDKHDKLTIMFFTFLLSALFYHLLNVHRLASLYKKISDNIKEVIKLNMATFFGWLAPFYALSYIDPATMLCMMMGTVPITNFMIKIKKDNYRSSYTSLFAIFFVVVSMVLIIIENIKLSNTNLAGTLFIQGAILAVIGGISGAHTGIYSSSLHKKDFSASEILSSRFFLLIIGSFLLALYNASFQSIEITDFKIFGASATIIIILPLFIYVKSIISLGPIIVGIFLPLIPIFAYFMQLYTQKYEFNGYICTSLIISSIAIGISNFFLNTSSKTID